MLKEEKTQATEVPLNDRGDEAQILFTILASIHREIRPAFGTTAEFSQ